MKAGVMTTPHGAVFCSGEFHRQHERKEFQLVDTQHKSICKVVHTDGTVEFIFWDEADLACPGGDCFETALMAFNNYCRWLNGEPNG